jgi:hypothetical protein
MPTPRTEPYRLSLVGPWELSGPDGQHVRSVLSQPKRLCLLAYLALAGRPVSRATVVSVFWPESDEERARNALSQALHYLRRSLSRDAIESLEGDRLLVSPEAVWFDARVLLGDEGSEVAAIAERAGDGAEFLEGWNADDSQPLQEWLDGVRREVREAAGEVRAEAKAASVDAGAPDPARADPADAERGNLGAPNGAARGELATDLRPTSHPHARARRPSLAGGAAAVVVMAVIVAVAMTRVPRSAAPADGRVLQVAVLMPQVAATDSAHLVSAEAVHAELLALLDAFEGLQIHSLPFAASASELRRILDAVGGADPPHAVLTVNARVAGGEVRVIGLLLGGPDYTETLGTSAETHRFTSDAGALLTLPQEIAGGVIRGVGRGLRASR